MRHPLFKPFTRLASIIQYLPFAYMRIALYYMHIALYNIACRIWAFTKGRLRQAVSPYNIRAGSAHHSTAAYGLQTIPLIQPQMQKNSALRKAVLPLPFIR